MLLFNFDLNVTFRFTRLILLF